MRFDMLASKTLSSLCTDDSSSGKDGARPAGDADFSTDLSGKLGKVLELSDPSFELILVLLVVIPSQNLDL